MAAQKRLSRKEIRQADPFIAFVQRATQQLAPHVRYVGVGVLVVLVIGAIVWGVQFQKEQTLTQLNTRLSEAAQTYTTNIKASSAGETVDWNDLRNQFEALYEDARGTEVYPVSMFYLMHVFMEQGKPDSAIGLGQELRNHVKDGDKRLLAAVLYELGKAYEMKGDFNTAAGFYGQASEISENPLGEFVQQEARRVSKGRLSPEIQEEFLQLDDTEKLPSQKPGKLRIKLDE